MMIRRTLWTIWALVPVAVLAFHFGPGQRAAARETAARLQAIAIDAERVAAEAQAAAYQAHLITIAARRATYLPDAGDATAEVLAEAALQEQAAYDAAADAWERAAELYEAVIETAGELGDGERRSLRLARGRAMVRSGDIWGGAGHLRDLVDELDTAGLGGEQLARDARAELAGAHYFGARILRLAGEPAEDWRAEAALARQQFRYLAETAAATGADASTVRDFEDNVERVLDLEQQDRSELEGAPLPRESPRAARGSRPGAGNEAGKTRQPRRGDQDARGASGVEAIGRGW